MGKVAIILRKAPYGDINAAEAVRHAMGGVSDELDVTLILVDSGVLLAKEGQDEAGTGFTNLGSALKDCIDMGVNVCAERQSLRDHFLETGDIAGGVKIVNGQDIAGIVQEAASTMIF